LLLLVVVLFGSSGAFACEKHLKGHHDGSDTEQEGSRS
jgi:hypothetical protein